ncbi:Hypothetical protein PHPALM_5950 [Phytophthora palmivora]|uniref:Uncharacterized protein n=1 Tax=Phytophthora palmivora TaxID=4796 RepID=A0A2P4YG35_9STRA|nr:Hypothetical protein PHPALM_5950 [Phytophthora palmivora]
MNVNGKTVRLRLSRNSFVTQLIVRHVDGGQLYVRPSQSTFDCPNLVLELSHRIFQSFLGDLMRLQLGRSINQCLITSRRQISAGVCTYVITCAKAIQRVDLMRAPGKKHSDAGEEVEDDAEDASSSINHSGEDHEATSDTVVEKCAAGSNDEEGGDKEMPSVLTRGWETPSYAMLQNCKAVKGCGGGKPSLAGKRKTPFTAAKERAKKARRKARAAQTAGAAEIDAAAALFSVAVDDEFGKFTIGADVSGLSRFNAFKCAAELAGRPDIVSQNDIDEFVADELAECGLDLMEGTSRNVFCAFLKRLRDAGRDFLYKTMVKVNFSIAGRRGARVLEKIVLEDGLYLVAGYNHEFVVPSAEDWINFISFVRPFIIFEKE